MSSALSTTVPDGYGPAFWVPQGTTARFILEALAAPTAPGIDLSGATPYLRVRPSPTSSTIILNAAIGSGLTWLDQAAGVFIWDIVPATFSAVAYTGSPLYYEFGYALADSSAYIPENGIGELYLDKVRPAVGASGLQLAWMPYLRARAVGPDGSTTPTYASTAYVNAAIAAEAARPRAPFTVLAGPSNGVTSDAPTWRRLAGTDITAAGFGGMQLEGNTVQQVLESADAILDDLASKASWPTLPDKPAVIAAGATQAEARAAVDAAASDLSGATTQAALGKLLPRWTGNVIIVGDSNSDPSGPNGVGASNMWGKRIETLPFFSQSAAFYNFAVAGKKITDIQADYATTVYPLRPSVTGIPTLVIIGPLGTNDALANATGATMITNYQALVASLVADGFTRVMAITPFSPQPASNATTQTALNGQGIRQLCNSIRATTTLSFVDAAAMFANVNESTYMQDGNHINAYGHLLLSREVQRVGIDYACVVYNTYNAIFADSNGARVRPTSGVNSRIYLDTISPTGFSSVEWNCTANSGKNYRAILGAPSSGAGVQDIWSLYNGTSNAFVFSAVDAATGSLQAGITIFSTSTYNMPKTVTPSGTTGARTINQAMGSVNFAAGAQTIIVTNSLVQSGGNTFCFANVNGNDATATSVRADTLTSGQITLRLNAPATAETRVDFVLFR